MSPHHVRVPPIFVLAHLSLPIAAGLEGAGPRAPCSQKRGNYRLEVLALCGGRSPRSLHHAIRVTTLEPTIAAAKSVMYEAVVLPKARPDLFSTGLTRNSKGVLLFGPPGA